MSGSILSMIPWLFTALVLGAMHITSAVILLGSRHFSAWLMLAGSCVTLLGQLGIMFYQIFMARAGGFKIEVITAISAFSSLGGLLFGIGLLLHALHQRSKANRVQELESILASLQKP